MEVTSFLEAVHWPKGTLGIDRLRWCCLLSLAPSKKVLVIGRHRSIGLWLCRAFWILRRAVFDRSLGDFNMHAAYGIGSAKELALLHSQWFVFLGPSFDFSSFFPS